MIYIPKEHYIGVQQRYDAPPTDDDDGTILLGFATPYTDDAAFQKRKKAVDAWVDGYEQRLPKGHPQRFTRIRTNDLVEGFEIAKSVKRYGWNGGNVVWRVVDPRGFELEISSANFASIISCTTIVNGVIQGNCIWGRDGAANILLPEQSEPYQEAVRMTQLKDAAANNKMTAKDLKPGYKIILKSGMEAEYLGRFWFVEQVWEGHKKITRIIERHSLKSANTISHVASLKFAAVSDTSTLTSIEDNAKIIADEFDNVKYGGSVVHVSPSKITLADISMIMEPSNPPTGDEAQYLITMYQGYNSSSSDEYCRYRYGRTKLFVCEVGDPSNPDRLDVNCLMLPSSRDNLLHPAKSYVRHTNELPIPYTTVDKDELVKGNLVCPHYPVRYYRDDIRPDWSGILQLNSNLRWYKLVLLCRGVRVETMYQ